MFRILLKKQLQEFFKGFFYDAKKGVSRSKIATLGIMALYTALMLGVFGMMFFEMMAYLSDILVPMGLGWLLFAMIALIAIVMGVLGSVFVTYSGVFLAKDNDLLLSMPIPVSVIVDARMVSVWILSLLFSGCVVLPAAAYWYTYMPLSVSVVIGPLLLWLLVSVIALILSAVLGWVIAKVSVHVRNKSLVSMILSLTFIGVYYYVYFTALNRLSELIAQIGTIGAKVHAYVYPLYMLGQTAMGDPLQALLMSALLAAGVVLIRRLIASSFAEVSSASHTAGVQHSEIKADSYAQTSAERALLKRELQRFLSSATYMLNCALGSILMVVAAGALLLKGGSIVNVLSSVFEGYDGYVKILLSGMAVMAAAMNIITVPSVSLEGKNIWISQSLPVDPWKILKAKLQLHLLLTNVPSFILSLAIGIIGHFSGLEMLVLIVYVQLVGLFFAGFGLIMGLLFPNLHWTSETAAVKQSLSVLVTMLSSMVYGIAMMLGVLVMDNPDLTMIGYCGIWMALTAAGAGICLFWLKKYGTEKYISL